MSNCLPWIVVFAAWSEFDDSYQPIWRNFLLLWNGAAGNGLRTSSKCYKRLNWSRVCLASQSRSLGFECAHLEPRDAHRIPSGPLHRQNSEIASANVCWGFEEGPWVGHVAVEHRSKWLTRGFGFLADIWRLSDVWSIASTIAMV